MLRPSCFVTENALEPGGYSKATRMPALSQMSSRVHQLILNRRRVSELKKRIDSYFARRPGASSGCLAVGIWTVRTANESIVILIVRLYQRCYSLPVQHLAAGMGFA